MISVKHDFDGSNEKFDELRYDFKLYIGHYGSYYLTSIKGIELKGQGIKPMGLNAIGQMKFRLSDKAYDRIEKKFRILSESHD